MQGFWTNVSRYPRFFITMTLGILINAAAPLVPLFKRPSTAIALSAVLISALAFVGLTLRAMLGFA